MLALWSYFWSPWPAASRFPLALSIMRSDVIALDVTRSRVIDLAAHR
jgi:hypothetical protein